MNKATAIGVVTNPFAFAKVTPEIAALAKALRDRDGSLFREEVKQVAKAKPAAKKSSVAAASVNEADLFGDEAAQALEPVKVKVTVMPKPRYSREVPDDLKIYHVPADINNYLTRLYPNLKIYANAFVYSQQINVDDVINSFILYLLEDAQDGKPRYTRYDPVKYPDQPYWKYLASTLRFFCMDFGSAISKHNATHLSASEIREDYSERTKGTISLDEVSSQQHQPDSIDYLFAQQILKTVYDFSNKYISKKPNAVCFENYAYSLMALKLEGYSNDEIAAKFLISQQGVMAWSVKLRALLSKILGEETGHVQAV